MYYISPCFTMWFCYAVLGWVVLRYAWRFTVRPEFSFYATICGPQSRYLEAKWSDNWVISPAFYSNHHCSANCSQPTLLITLWSIARCHFTRHKSMSSLLSLASVSSPALWLMFSRSYLNHWLANVPKFPAATSQLWALSLRAADGIGFLRVVSSLMLLVFVHRVQLLSAMLTVYFDFRIIPIFPL